MANKLCVPIFYAQNLMAINFRKMPTGGKRKGDRYEKDITY
nr:MAG TPA: hypothetical protein [Caudoviricetes sp.]